MKIIMNIVAAENGDGEGTGPFKVSQSGAQYRIYGEITFTVYVWSWLVVWCRPPPLFPSLSLVTGCRIQVSATYCQFLTLWPPISVVAGYCASLLPAMADSPLAGQVVPT